MQQAQTIPRWVGLVPAHQGSVVVLYGMAVLVDTRLPEMVFTGLVFGSPLIFGPAWALGRWVSRRRGATRPDGSEYMLATLGNVLMGFGLAVSCTLWIAIVWSALRGLPD